MEIEDIVDKTVERVEKWEQGVTIHFTDGTEITIYARGSEEVWIAIE